MAKRVLLLICQFGNEAWTFYLDRVWPRARVLVTARTAGTAGTAGVLVWSASSHARSRAGRGRTFASFFKPKDASALLKQLSLRHTTINSSDREISQVFHWYRAAPSPPTAPPAAPPLRQNQPYLPTRGHSTALLSFEQCLTGDIVCWIFRCTI